MTREEARASIKKHLDLMYPYNTPKDVLKVAYEALGQPEIVRCKDCRYALPSSKNAILCTAPCESQYPKAYKPIDWFCAGGEREIGE